jgi:UDP-N-acetyl-D-mannosaminuronic acid dehydrogenase
MGLGNVGLSVALYVSHFFDTVGYDIKLSSVLNLSKMGIKASDKLEKVDVYIISVSTFYKSDGPDMSAVDDCCLKIRDVNPDALVCFESTLFVGTARKLSLKHHLKYTVVCPERWWEDDLENHGIRQLRVLGALNDESMEKAILFYKALQIPINPVSSLELAEATKIAENAHRYVQIAFAEELAVISEKNALDFKELREAMNTKWNVDLPEARSGIGKSCLPKDTALLLLLYPDASILQGAIKANDEYVKSLKSKINAPGKPEFGAITNST